MKKKKASSRLRELVQRSAKGFYASLLQARMEEALKTRWQARQRARELESKAPVHVSDLLGSEFCLRQVWYKLKEPPQPFELHSAKKLMIWYDGDTGEQQLTTLFNIAKVKRLEPKQQYGAGKVTGTPDDVRRFMGRRWIIECKTLHGVAWRQLMEPTRQYLQQIVSYLMLYGIRQGVVAVKGKDMSDWKFFEVRLKRHMEVAREMAGRIKAAIGLVEGGTIPHRYCQKPSDRKAKTCQFRDVCFVRDAAKP